MKIYFTFLIIFLGLSSHVFSQEAINLVPLAPVGHFANGREYIPLSNDLIRVELGFDGTYENKLVFDLVIMNQTGDTLSVDPGKFYYLNLDDPDADSSSYPPRLASTPKMGYKWYDRALYNKGSADVPYPVQDFVEVGVDFIAAAAAFLSAFDPDLVIETSFYPEDQHVSGEAIPDQGFMEQHDLDPGGLSSGFISFPFHADTGYLMFCFPIADQEFQYVYQRLKTSDSH